MSKPSENRDALQGRFVSNMRRIGAITNNVGYTATKHGVIGLTKTAALEYAEDRIRVNAVCPGFIKTPMIKESLKQGGLRVISQIPLGRLGRPAEIAEMVVWLCSDRASYVTGVAYVVDGGWTAT